MKLFKETKLTFITPAFLAGADQNSPEIRVPSIRGELRWWFRVLGGTRNQEISIFGGVHDGATASKVVLRVISRNLMQGQEIRMSPNTTKSYLYYFAQVSGNKVGVHRTEAGHYVAVGSEFALSISLRVELASEERALLEKAVAAFLKLGALGLRATRGCGAFTDDDQMSKDEFLSFSQTLGPSVFVGLATRDLYSSGDKCQLALGSFLQNLRGDNHLSSRKRSALGFSECRVRESSALRLRPVKVAEGYLPVVVYTDAACDQSSLLDLVKSACI